MGRSPCCDKTKVKRGTWSPEEDAILKNYLHNHGTGGNWIALPHKAGLKRCGKSCRLRWLNYLRPNIKLGGFTEDEECIIYNLYNKIGSRWSVIASQLPGRTDNDVKNYWNTKLKRKLLMASKNDMESSAAASETAAATTGAAVTPQIAPYRLESVANYEPINFDSLGTFILEGSSDCSSGGNDVNFPFYPSNFEEDSSSFCMGMVGSNEVEMEGYSWDIVSRIWSQEEVVRADVDGADLFSIFHVDSKPHGVSQTH